MIANVILGALFYMRQDFPTIDKHQWLQKLIVFIVVGWVIWYTWKEIIKIFFFFFLHHGYFTIVTAQSLGYIVFGRLLTRMGMRITLMTCPISIAKVWLPHDQGVLIIVYLVLISIGQLISYITTITLIWYIYIYIYIYYNRCDLIMMFYNGHMPFFFFFFFFKF